jgi:membrane fusion protein, copper/silver efflux system
MKFKPLLLKLKRIVPPLAQLLVVVALIVTAFVAYNLGAGSGGHDTDSATTTTQTATRAQGDHSQSKPTDEELPVYTCSMHPQIRQNEPGNCPICGMELVLAETVDAPSSDHAQQGHATGSKPLGYACAMNCLPPLEEPGPCPICGMEMQPVYSGSPSSTAPASPRQLTMSAEAVALASIQTTAVERRMASRSVRLVGELTVDPRRRAHISANVGGRVDELLALFEGDRVAKGDHVVSLYSPELLAVQRELLQALRSLQRDRDSGRSTMDGINEAAVSAMRERLRLAGLSVEQIDEIARQGVAQESVRINAPVGGVVIARYVEEGDYVASEARILSVADLGVLWAELEAYESDLEWLRVGQQVSLTTEALPGRSFQGEVAWIDPFTDSSTRTTRIRVDVGNDQELLKPGMYVTAGVESTLGEDPRLIIPQSAPLITGKRAIAYVETPSSSQPTFEGREIVLGPRTEDGYVVIEGLNEGDRVVTNGAFQIDSALQIIARPSMMSPDGGQAMTGHEGHGMDTPANEPQETHDHDMPEASANIEGVDASALIGQYLVVQDSLAGDNFEEARAAWDRLAVLAGESGNAALQAETTAGAAAEDITGMRTAFQPISNRLIALVQSQGNPTGTELHVVHCPMAFEWAGADWLQAAGDVRNPYFGAEMLRCGTVREEVSPQ